MLNNLKENKMKLTNKQQNYLLSKYKYNAYGDTHSVFIIENDCEVWRKDLTDHTSLHLLSDKEVSLLLALSPDRDINQTTYTEEKIQIAEASRGVVS